MRIIERIKNFFFESEEQRLIRLYKKSLISKKFLIIYKLKNETNNFKKEILCRELDRINNRLEFLGDKM